MTDASRNPSPLCTHIRLVNSLIGTCFSSASVISVEGPIYGRDHQAIFLTFLGIPVISCLTKLNHLTTRFARINTNCLGGGIGRRKGLKIPRGLAPCRFDSGPRHQLNQGFRKKAKSLFSFLHPPCTTIVQGMNTGYGVSHTSSNKILDCNAFNLK